MQSRRDILKSVGLGASALALSPFLQHMRLHAAGDEKKLPKRFVFVVKSNGLLPYGIIPQGLENKINGSSLTNTKNFSEYDLKNNKLHSSMKSLEPLKNHLNIINGPSSGICKGAHGGKAGMLGSYSMGDQAPPRMASLDTMLMRAFPSIFPMIAFHGGAAKFGQFTYLRVSAIGKGRSTPAYVSPELAYKDIFSTVMSGDRASAEVDAKKNLLDFLAKDIKKAKKSLNGSEKEKLDLYLDGFESLRDRQSKLLGMKDTLAKHAPKFGESYITDIQEDRLKAHFEMSTAALVTGLTNVITINTDNLTSRYEFSKSTTDSGGTIHPNIHGIGHMKDGPLGRKLRDDIRGLHIDCIAKMAQKLNSIPEGNGTMLDNTLILYLSDAGHLHHSTFGNVPTLMLGNINSQFKTGRFLDYPSKGNQGHMTFRSVLQTILKASGLKTDIGDKDKTLSSRIDQDNHIKHFFK